MPPAPLKVSALAARDFVDQVNQDPASGRTQKAVELSWIFGEGQPPSPRRARVLQGKVQATGELPTFARGQGTSPDSVQYRLFGKAACYATTFAGAAAQWDGALGPQGAGRERTGSSQADGPELRPDHPGCEVHI